MMEFQISRNLPEQVADYLKDRIIRLEFSPGERIIEKRIADETGVSQVPVREAFRILERHYLVENLPRKGARVTEMTESMVEWLFDLAALLLPLVARRGIENGEPQDIVDLRKALDGMEKCAKENDVEGHIRAIAEYAAVSTRGTKNPFLVEMVNQLWPATMRFQFASIPLRKDDIKQMTTLYSDTYHNLERGDTEGAAAVVTRLVEIEREYASSVVASYMDGQHKYPNSG